jgi:hypothetical protein
LASLYTLVNEAERPVIQAEILMLIGILAVAGGAVDFMSPCILFFPLPEFCKRARFRD